MRDYKALFVEYSKTDSSAAAFCRDKGIPYRSFLRAAKDTGFDVVNKKWAGSGTHPNSQRNLIPLEATHGVWAFRSHGMIRCDHCSWSKDCDYFMPGETCRVLADIQEGMKAEIMSLPHITAEDSLLVNMIVRETAIQELVMRYIDKVGLIDESKGKLQAVMREYYYSVNSLSRLLDKLGLSPVSRKRLGITPGQRPPVTMYEKYVLKVEEKDGSEGEN